MKIERSIKGAALTAADYAASIKESATIRAWAISVTSVARRAELCVIESSGHAPYRDRHSPTSHPAREPGLHDRHLGDCEMSQPPVTPPRQPSPVDLRARQLANSAPRAMRWCPDRRRRRPDLPPVHLARLFAVEAPALSEGKA